MNLFFVDPITGDLVTDEVKYYFHVLLFKLLGDRIGHLYEFDPWEDMQ